MILLLLACATQDMDSATPPAPETIPAKWTAVDLSCQLDTVVLEGWSQGTQGSSALFVFSGEVEEESVTGTVPWEVLGADPAGSWQHWQVVELLDAMPCPAIDTWQALLLDSQETLLACMDDQGLAC